MATSRASRRRPRAGPRSAAVRIVRPARAGWASRRSTSSPSARSSCGPEAASPQPEAPLDLLGVGGGGEAARRRPAPAAGHAARARRSGRRSRSPAARRARPGCGPRAARASRCRSLPRLARGAARRLGVAARESAAQRVHRQPGDQPSRRPPRRPPAPAFGLASASPRRARRAGSGRRPPWRRRSAERPPRPSEDRLGSAAQRAQRLGGEERLAGARGLDRGADRLQAAQRALPDRLRPHRVRRDQRQRRAASERLADPHPGADPERLGGPRCLTDHLRPAGFGGQRDRAG